MKLTIDFETRSRADIKKVGAWAYAQHPSTEIMCMAVMVGSGELGIYIPEKFQRMIDHTLPWGRSVEYGYETFDGHELIKTDSIHGFIPKYETIEAHNAGFERAIWEEICVKRLGWPKINPRVWRCSAAKAAAHSLPRSLEGAGAALGLPIQKDKEGHRIMLKLCKPRKSTKNNPKTWHEDPEDLLKLFHYCLTDIEAEHALSASLRDLSVKEQELWHLDQEINARGVYVDVDAAKAAINVMSTHSKKLQIEVDALTHDMVTSVTQVSKTLDWLKTRGVDLPNLQKETVKEALRAPDMNADARRVLEIRQSLGKSSTSKYNALVNVASEDDQRARGLFMYCAAGTGRWGGKYIQPQNLPRPEFDDTDTCMDIVASGDLELLELMYGDPMAAMSSCIRGALTAAPGHDLVCADFSAIEARVLAWLAGEKKTIDGFIRGLDPYKVGAAGIYSTTYDKVTKDQRRIGKVAELALGYQGGWRAFMSMAANYGVKVPEDVRIVSDDELKDASGKKLTEEQGRWQKWAAPIVKAWRREHPNIVRFWVEMEQTVYETVRTGKTHIWGNIKWGIEGNFLHCKLPSGRMLSYYDPQIKDKKAPWGEVKSTTSYMSVNTMAGYRWERTHTYGGKLVENITQAVARCLLSDAMTRTENKGYPTVIHVHDEIVAEVPEGWGDLAEFETLMAKVPPWAEGCPIKAEGWRGKRYRK